MDSRITEILEQWFITEPALFQVLCTHEIVSNSAIACPMRCGRRKVEYNPDYLREMSDTALKTALGTEAIRLLLKHPYERLPDGCCNQAVAIGSNLTIGDNYKSEGFNIDRPADYGLEKGRPYEWYSRRIQQMLPPELGAGEGRGAAEGEELSEAAQSLADSADSNRDLSELWGEDDLSIEMINGVIEGCCGWGSLGGSFAEQIKASTRAKLNWRTVLCGFRSAVLSSKKRYTRMRPNRRYDFDQPGEKCDFETKLLVAVDVSGSISTESLQYFYGVINSAFRYGFKEIDVIQFDCGVRVVQSLKNALRETIAVGRGGTSFQEPVDYANENGYNGLMILTDGYAPQPVIPENTHCKIIWVCESKDSYDCNNEWMRKSGRVCTIELR